MWSERTPNEIITQRIWPRAMATAERLWSSKKIRDVENFYHRQDQLSRRLNLTDNALLKRIDKEASQIGVTAETLKDFFSWLGPGKFYSQHRYRTINTSTKWTMWVDVIPSESFMATQLNWKFEKWLKNKSPKELADIEKTILSWASLSTALAPMQSRSFGEKEELIALGKDLNVLSRVAIDAMNYLKSGDRPGGLWAMENRTKLAMTAQVRSGMQLSMQALVERMVHLVGDKHQLPQR